MAAVSRHLLLCSVRLLEIPRGVPVSRSTSTMPGNYDASIKRVIRSGRHYGCSNRDYVNEKAHLSRWNEARVIHVEELTPGRVEESSSRAVRRATNWQQCQGSPLLVGPPPARRCSDESTRARGRPAQSVPCALVGQQGFQGSPAAQVDRDAFQGGQCRRPTLPLDGLSGRRVQPGGAVR